MTEAFPRVCYGWKIINHARDKISPFLSSEVSSLSIESVSSVSVTEVDALVDTTDSVSSFFVATFSFKSGELLLPSIRSSSLDSSLVSPVEDSSSRISFSFLEALSYFSLRSSQTWSETNLEKFVVSSEHRDESLSSLRLDPVIRYRVVGRGVPCYSSLTRTEKKEKEREREGRKKKARYTRVGLYPIFW